MTLRTVFAGILACMSGGCLPEGEPRDVSANVVEAAAEAIPVSIEVVATSSSVDEPLSLKVIASNPGLTDVTFLIWNTPFESPVSADMFTVTRDGEALSYIGMMLRRALPPPDTDLVRLAAGDSLESVVDLSELYPVDLPGEYTIAFDPAPVAIGEPDVSDTSLSASDSQVTVTRY